MTNSDCQELVTYLSDYFTLTEDLIDTIYPVGSIYVSVSSTSPSTLFGGTWVQIKDKFLLAQGDTYTTAEATGGEATHTLTTNEIPSHRHSMSKATQYASNTSATKGASIGYSSSGEHFDSSYSGGGQAHNNLPPYIVVYVWKRTA